MVYNIIRRNQILKVMNIKRCKSNCICENRIKNTLQKVPVNIIYEVFIKFQLRDQKIKYDKCSKRL